MKFNGDSLAVNKDAFSSNVNNEIKLSTRSSIDNEVLQNGNLLKFLEHATGIVSPFDNNICDRMNMTDINDDILKTDEPKVLCASQTNRILFIIWNI